MTVTTGMKVTLPPMITIGGYKGLGTLHIDYLLDGYDTGIGMLFILSVV